MADSVFEMADEYSRMLDTVKKMPDRYFKMADYFLKRAEPINFAKRAPELPYIVVTSKQLVISTCMFGQPSFHS